jgi:hypothetical protein
MNRTVLFFSLSAVVSLTGAVAACSSSTTTTDQPTEEAGVKEGGGGNVDAGTGTDSAPNDTDSGNTTDPDTMCAAMATKNDCGMCCIAAHKAGYDVFQKTLLDCTCKGTGADGGAPCATDCATTICAATPKNADATCNACLQASINSGGACQGSVAATCQADPGCLAEQKCIQPCTKKP